MLAKVLAIVLVVAVLGGVAWYFINRNQLVDSARTDAAKGLAAAQPQAAAKTKADLGVLAPTLGKPAGASSLLVCAFVRDDKTGHGQRCTLVSTQVFAAPGTLAQSVQKLNANPKLTVQFGFKPLTLRANCAPASAPARPTAVQASVRIGYIPGSSVKKLPPTCRDTLGVPREGAVKTVQAFRWEGLASDKNWIAVTRSMPVSHTTFGCGSLAPLGFCFNPIGEPVLP